MDKSEPMVPDHHLQAVLDIWGQKRVQITYPISGNCMSPMIKDGDTLTIEHGFQDIHIGDIVAYGPPRRPAIHRVIKIVEQDGGRLFLLKPDRSNVPNPFISEDQILGKVIEIHGGHGRLSLTSFFGHWMNFILAIRSCVAWKHSSGEGLFWKGIHKIMGIRSKYLLPKYSLDMILWKGIRRAQRLRSMIENSVLTHKKRR